MALCRDGDKYYIKHWMGYNQPRPKLYLGKVSKQQAILFNARLNELIKAKKLNSSPKDSIIEWSDKLDGNVRRKLEQWKLLEPKPENKKFKDIVQEYIDLPRQVKEITKNRWRNAQKKIEVFFADKTIAEITSRDAEKFKVYLTETSGLSENTARKLVSFTRQFMGYAVSLELITKNPFAEQKTSFLANDDKQYYITPEIAQKVLDACPDAQWRLIWGLCRWGGLRCPSEVLAMKWTDVNFADNSFIVRSSKTARYNGKDSRIVPMFQELKPLFQDAFDNAKDGDVYCISRQGDNLRTQMTRIIESAGIDVWQKIFVNCRSTRQTELLKMTNGNIKVVCKWLGNSPEIALKHYAQITDDDMKEAVKAELLAV